MLSAPAFAAERHKVWEARQAGLPQPWTDDLILASHKFTNLYRVLDPGSQFVFGLDHADPRERFMRCVLYRVTNYPKSWDAYLADTGEYPLVATLDALADFWCAYRDKGNQIFSGAYMILPHPGHSGDKVRQAVELAQRAMRVWPAFEKAERQADRHEILRRVVGLGDFLAMQILTDWGYLQKDDLENVFIVAGPGSSRGAAVISPKTPATEVFRKVMTELTDIELCGRIPSLMDTQNLMCEYYKYHRYHIKGSSGRPYRPAHSGEQPAPLLPVWWNPCT